MIVLIGVCGSRIFSVIRPGIDEGAFLSAPDLTEFVAESRKIGQKRFCPIAPVLSALKPVERAQLLAALDSDKQLISAGAVAAWLKKRGYGINHHSVRSHRDRTCTCND